MTPEELIRGGTLRRDEMRVCLNPEILDEYEDLQRQQAADRAAASDSFAGSSRGPALEARAGELLEEMEAHTLTLVLQALPRREYRALADKHPPRKDADGNLLPRDVRLGVDYDAFYSELARRSIVEPQLDAATLDVLLDEKLTDGQWDELTSRAHNLNRSSVDLPFSSAGSTSRRRSSAK